MKRLRQGLKIISEIISPGHRVLDLGCGDGTLLEYLRKEKNVHGWGLDIDYKNVLACIAKGIPVFQGDINEELPSFHDDLYDFVIISQTLQEIQFIEKLLLEALRISDKVIVTYPNFGYIANRFYLFFRGHLPVTKNFPHTWYRSPNIHLFSTNDFRNFCKANGIRIIREIPYNENTGPNALFGKLFPNLFAQYNLVILQGKDQRK